ncbi:MAG: histidine kinase [Pseudohongiella sp.]|nr:histidine kinase [Pseudohongiella sp.]MDO9521969.1 histidine kinase [Pseudohongiella sp.]MDP2128604.1 histidine kinase [Pseudohongiella sp.]
MMDSFWNSNKTQNFTGAAVLVIVSMLSVYLLAQSAQGWSTRLSIISALFMLELTCYFISTSEWAEKSRSRLLALLAIEAATILALYFMVNISFIAILGIVWIVQVTETFPIRTTSWLLLACVSLFTASQLYHWGDNSLMLAITGSVTLGLFHLFAVIATHRAKREQELREETVALNRELLATRELLTEHSRQTERLRIARDLHDLLGHHLTAQILQLEVATHLTDGQGRQKVEQALALGKLLLSDLRTAVSELREDEPINFHDAVKKLVSGVPGITVKLDFTTMLGEIQLAETLLRCTREALTNVLRHSGASSCTIHFSEKEGYYYLRISDNGKRSESITPGNGLKGIKERIEEAGGQVSWTCNKGFSLEIRMPVNQQAAANQTSQAA